MSSVDIFCPTSYLSYLRQHNDFLRLPFATTRINKRDYQKILAIDGVDPYEIPK